MELWHLCNRGVDGRNLTEEEVDKVRFVHDLYEMNDAQPTGNVGKYFKYTDLRSPYIPKHDKERRKRELLVHIHAWCLMGNHYHLLLSELVEGGLTMFLRKFNIGYAKYFNERHNRSGTLFQGRTKKILIADQAHFNYILHYIHCNPLDFLEGAQDWRHGTIASADVALEYLRLYKWSSFQDYIGAKNFPSVVYLDYFKDVFPNYEKTLKNFLVDRESEAPTSLWLE